MILNSFDWRGLREKRKNDSNFGTKFLPVQNFPARSARVPQYERISHLSFSN